jgi:hypothetical protein
VVAALSISLAKRADQLARSGRCKKVIDIKRCLEAEGYSSSSVDECLDKEGTRMCLEKILWRVEMM